MKDFLDNFFKDLMTYFPLFIYIYLLKQLKSTDYEKIFISTVLASIFLLFFAFIFDRKFKYGNNYFLVQNTVCNVILISIFLLRKKINIFYYVMICLVFLFFIIFFIKKPPLKKISLYIKNIFSKNGIFMCF